MSPEEEEVQNSFKTALRKIARLQEGLISASDPSKQFEIEQDLERLYKQCKLMKKHLDDGLFKLNPSSIDSLVTVFKESDVIDPVEIVSPNSSACLQQPSDLSRVENNPSGHSGDMIENIYPLLTSYPPLDSIRVNVVKDLFKQINAYYASIHPSSGSELNPLRFSENLINGSLFLMKIIYLQGFTQLSEKDKLVVALAYTDQETYLNPKFCNWLGVLTEANIRSGIRHAKRKFDETLGQD